MNLPLEGKVAVVTGGSRGIGAAIVERLAKDGADVAFNYSNSKQRADQIVAKVAGLGRKAIAYKADQGSAADVQNFIKSAHADLGRIDILVNSAGVFITGHVGDQDADLASFDRQIDINIKGVVSAVRAVTPLMSDGGRIVSIGTTGAERIPFQGAADYVATKAAIAAYTRGWSRDLGPRDITVNIIQPGAINTEMNPEDAGHADALRALTSLGRYGQPQDIAAAVAFLVGPEAGYITGSTLNVDGGQIA
ncbi:3-oxoacyl-[acyl-carrier protein] reductase [Sphingobium sp. AP50]|uniref:SDR family NAD(P)-dependent oxidoreductase n=1 Tax=Sphingobium sp. AP50 TaxID=1884369 RepID=UPI0008B91091|nr:SDR family oxidoreductase [Sphingobium sp. AP50]SEJ81360.1 3-oxoacyl-[acyl-carrier protein] reductase [Sphingobium sp. AP50]